MVHWRCPEAAPRSLVGHFREKDESAVRLEDLQAVDAGGGELGFELRPDGPVPVAILGNAPGLRRISKTVCMSFFRCRDGERARWQPMSLPARPRVRGVSALPWVMEAIQYMSWPPLQLIVAPVM